MGLKIKVDILQYIRLYTKRVEVKILFGQRLWDVDSWFSYRRNEAHFSRSCIFEGVENFKGERAPLN